MKKYIALFLLMCCFIVSCKGKKEDTSFFTKGKKVKSGLIWQKTPITAEEILKETQLKPVFSEKFTSGTLGKQWDIQGGTWKVVAQTLFSPIAQNRNIVLKGVELPENAVIKLDMWSESDAVDIKFNLYGDGKIHDHGDGYTFIMGGWNNRISVISKLDEHEKNRVENRSGKWNKSTVYRIKVIKEGRKIYWFIDDDIFLARYDEKPLKPADGYKYLSFANWKSKAFFDNLEIFEIVKKEK